MSLLISDTSSNMNDHMNLFIAALLYKVFVTNYDNQVRLSSESHLLHRSVCVGQGGAVSKVGVARNVNQRKMSGKKVALKDVKTCRLILKIL